MISVYGCKFDNEASTFSLAKTQIEILDFDLCVDIRFPWKR